MPPTTSAGVLANQEDAPLIATFRNVTNSYKHLFFRALLHRVALGEGPAISFEALFRGMLEEAWWPGFHFRLHLGLRDRVVAHLEAALPDPDRLRWEQGEVSAALAAIPFDVRVERRRGLLRHVPQRLISAWFDHALAGLPDGQVDSAIVRLSREPGLVRPPYAIEEDGIVLDAAWLAWLREQFAIVQGWSDALWLDFLEARNPNVPGLVEKIRPSFRRGSLAEQRALWSAVLALGPVSCIYTGRPLDHARFDLDHFLPRSFVAHDRLWNLTPVAPDLNGRKRDHLPDLTFVNRLAAQHAMVDQMEARLAARPRRVWRKGLDDLAIDFRIEAAVPRDAGILAATYRDVFGALVGIAARMGFKQGWRPDDNSQSSRGS